MWVGSCDNPHIFSKSDSFLEGPVVVPSSAVSRFGIRQVSFETKVFHPNVNFNTGEPLDDELPAKIGDSYGYPDLPTTRFVLLWLMSNPNVFNPIILLPITTAFQRAEAESLITSRMQNKQYRPLRSSNKFPSLQLAITES